MLQHLLPALITGVVLAAPAPSIRLTEGRFEAVGLVPGELESARLTVFVGYGKDPASKDQPAILGSSRVVNGVLRFEPRFPLVAGVQYRAVLQLGNGKEVRAEFDLPRPKPAVAARVTHVYPSRDTLPENQLKFYLHFSVPMTRGEAYRHIRILDAAGKPIDEAFLELGEELWDADGQRFTLFFDPGRIKRGLKPREDLGPVLVEGKRFTLVIDPTWADAAGNPLQEAFRKPFRVTAPDDTPPDPKGWKLEAPAAGRLDPLKVRFPEPLDHALLHRLLSVTDAQGRRIPGKVQVTDEETRWLFTPDKPWQAGRYDLVIDTTLEDLAGNSIGRPFEVDQFQKIDRKIQTETVQRAFEVRAAD